MTAKRPRGPRLTPREIVALEAALLKEPHVPASFIGRRLGVQDSTAQAHKRRLRRDGRMVIESPSLTPYAAAVSKAEAKERERLANAGRLTFPQLIGMGASLVTVTAVLLGGLLWLTNSSFGSVRGEISAQETSINLQLRTVSEVTAMV